MKWRGRQLRPLWQIPFRFVVWLIYVPARAYVDFVDDYL